MGENGLDDRVCQMTLDTVRDLNLVWFRQDLRIHDHEPLVRACQVATDAGEAVFPVYVVDPRLFRETTFGFPRFGCHRRRFLRESLSDLDRQLQSVGSCLHYFVGKPESVLPNLCRVHPVKRAFFYRYLAYEEREIENTVCRTLAELGVDVRPANAPTLYTQEHLPFEISNIPEVFSRFRHQVESRVQIDAPLVAAPLAPPSSVPGPQQAVEDAVCLDEIEELSLPVDDSINQSIEGVRFQGGEMAAFQRINEYFWETDCIRDYKHTRNGMLKRNDSSKLSPWLAMGCISARQVHHEVKRYEDERTKNESTYWLIFELMWRDYFAFISSKHGSHMFRIGGLRRKRLPWSTDFQSFEQWRQGKTGFPLIDANMIELNSTGFMSNRGRQNVASFLTKNLGIDWRMGAEWFESRLIDYDPSSNYGNWNYIAGIGNDSKSFRWFNTIKQSHDYDPKGEYVRHWIPALKNVPDTLVHTPWKMTPQQQRQYGCVIDSDYPGPMVDLFQTAESRRQLCDDFGE